jgi:hypothetical protein
MRARLLLLHGSQYVDDWFGGFEASIGHFVAVCVIRARRARPGGVRSALQRLILAAAGMWSSGVTGGVQADVKPPQFALGCTAIGSSMDGLHLLLRLRCSTLASLLDMMPDSGSQSAGQRPCTVKPGSCVPCDMHVCAYTCASGLHDSSNQAAQYGGRSPVLHQ